MNVKTLMMFMLLSEQARGWPTWSARATWCPRTPCCWPLLNAIVRFLPRRRTIFISDVWHCGDDIDFRNASSYVQLKNI